MSCKKEWLESKVNEVNPNQTFYPHLTRVIFFSVSEIVINYGFAFFPREPCFGLALRSSKTTASLVKHKYKNLIGELEFVQ